MQHVGCYQMNVSIMLDTPLCSFKDNVEYTRCCPKEWNQIPESGNILLTTIIDIGRINCQHKDCPFWANNESVWSFS